jgi:hypothetical protein
MKIFILLFAILFMGCAGNHGFFYERSFWSPMRMYKEECQKDVYITHINGQTYVSILNDHSSAHMTKQEYLDMAGRLLAKGSINQRTYNCMIYAVE